jgi:RNA polymerase sigma-70 factor (ECF subfamily)
MNEGDWLAERFEENRSHLRAVAYRMLGSVSEADDAVQEAWLRLSRSDTRGIENLGGESTPAPPSMREMCGALQAGRPG